MEKGTRCSVRESVKDLDVYVYTCIYIYTYIHIYIYAHLVMHTTDAHERTYSNRLRKKQNGKFLLLVFLFSMPLLTQVQTQTAC
jgi:hypothetical protein